VDSIILGPGRLEQAHSPQESVQFNQVVQAAQVYLEYARAVQRGYC
jgi:acetylornithine deacetylase/succinyl-diaminopimelate desuccinylase-like protein